MTEELVIFEHNKIKVTEGQKNTLKKAVFSQQPTDAEMELFFYDCARRGVHPLDKLIIFTKRSGKYTPITSIDYMRQRAESTGVYAGSDDAVFEYKGQQKEPFAATVTVHKIVQGMKVSFTHTARMAEYRPPGEAFMWKKMPHNQLAKCAEAGALRKGFPTFLDKLYISEEMDQAGVVDGDAPLLEAADPPVGHEADEVVEGKVVEESTSTPSEETDTTPEAPTPQPEQTSKEPESEQEPLENMPEVEPSPPSDERPWTEEGLSVEDSRNIMYAWATAEWGYDNVDKVREAIVDAEKWTGNPPIPDIATVDEIATYLQEQAAA
jgi:phage recombination protein Bet